MIVARFASLCSLFATFGRLFTDQRVFNGRVVWFLYSLFIGGCTSHNMLYSDARMLPTEADTTSQHVQEPVAGSSNTWAVHFFDTPVSESEGFKPLMYCVCFPLTSQETGYSVTGSTSFLPMGVKAPYHSCILHQRACLVVKPTLDNGSGWYAHHRWRSADGEGRRGLTPPYSYYCSANCSGRSVKRTEIQNRVALWRRYATIGIKPWVEDKHLAWFFDHMVEGQGFVHDSEGVWCSVGDAQTQPHLGLQREARHDFLGAWYSVDDPRTKCYLGLLRKIFEHPSFPFNLVNLPDNPFYFCFVSRKEVFMYKKVLRAMVRSHSPQGCDGFFSDLIEIVLKFLPIGEPPYLVELHYARRAKKLQRTHQLPHYPLSLGFAMHTISDPVGMGLLSAYNRANLSRIVQLVHNMVLPAEIPDLQMLPSYHDVFLNNCPVSFFMQLSADVLNQIQQGFLRLVHETNSPIPGMISAAAKRPKQITLEPGELRALCLAFCANTHDIFTYFGAADYENEDQYRAEVLAKDVGDETGKRCVPFDRFDFKLLFEEALYPCAPSHAKQVQPFPVFVAIDEVDREIYHLKIWSDSRCTYFRPPWYSPRTFMQ